MYLQLCLDSSYVISSYHLVHTGGKYYVAKVSKRED